MKITILTYGSRGDIQPFLALAVGLQRAGHQLKLAAPGRFGDFIKSHTIPFVPLAGDPEVISQRLNDAGTNPFAMVRGMSHYIFAIADQVARGAFKACEDADLIVHSFLFTTGGHALALKLGIPDVSVQTFPIFAPTRAFPPVSMSNLPPGPLSYFFHWVNIQVFWHGGNVGFRRLQKSDPETFDLKLQWPFRKNWDRLKTPLIFAFSPTVVPRPDDWTIPHIHVPGYFFLESMDSFKPPPGLRDFISSGEPPVCVNFGSMVHKDAEKIYRFVFDALRKTGNRIVVLKGWSNTTLEPATDMFVADDIPHAWLFKRCKAVIHHGGAGTTAAGLRSGIPNIVIPFAADQPFWGARVHALGAGPLPIPAKKLTIPKLIAALAEADEDAIKSNVHAAGRQIRSETGVATTVKLIEKYADKR